VVAPDATAERMKPVVAHLTEQDMVDLVAYLASLNP
jgi:cytochrome c553